MRVYRRVLLAVVPPLAAGVLLVGCGEEDELPTPVEVLRPYQADFEAVRQRLREVASVLPTGRAGAASCDVPAPLDPPLVYQTGDLAESNTEVMMERQLTDPDATTRYEDGFSLGETHLLTALRWTGPHGPLGDNSIDYPRPNHPLSVEYSLRSMRTVLDQGRATRYVLVLRQVEYVPPEITNTRLWDGSYVRNFVGKVVVDAFLVDLERQRLLCRFSAEEAVNPMGITFRLPEGATGAMSRHLEEGIGLTIAATLKELTRGTVDAPPA